MGIGPSMDAQYWTFRKISCPRGQNFDPRSHGFQECSGIEDFTLQGTTHKSSMKLYTERTTNS